MGAAPAECLPRDRHFLSLNDDKCKHLSESTVPFSPIRAEILDPTSDAGWDSAVERHSGHTCFHTSAWTKVLCATYGHKPFYFKFYHGPKLAGLFPLVEISSRFTGRRGICLPFSDLCNPLLFENIDSGEAVKTITALAREKGWKYFELRSGRELLSPSTPVAEKYYGHSLDLTIGIDELFVRFQSPVRRAVRKAEKSGLTVEASDTREAMRDFYRLHVRTRRRHGLPPQSLAFFLNIHEQIIKAGLGFVVLAKSGTRPIAAAVFFYSGENALFKFGASDERSQGFRGNNLVMWEGIKQLVGKGLQRLHFGRTSTDNEGLRSFKLSWGSEEEIIKYFRFSLRSNSWVDGSHNASGFHNHLFRRLPLRINRLAGALIYPHLD